ncbi:MAG TPA: TlpA disulfide reductase family protein [Terricaulis sp.]|nr:TlpA disulfide reductase family protein [Terricaulis sp.]
MIAIGLFAFLYVVFAASSKPEASGALTRHASGEMAKLAVLSAPPPMPLRLIQDAAGAETSLAAFEGEIVVLNIWFTACAPCIHEMPSLAALQRRYEGRIRVVPISIDGEAKRADAVRMLAELSGGDLPFFIDISRGVAFDIAAAGFPVTVIYGRDGRELARLAGGADWASEDAFAVIDAVLARE